MKISIPKEDLLKGQLHPNGWKKGVIIDVSTKQSKDKQSLNYNYVIKYETGSKVPGDETREIKSQFNSKAMGFMTDFLAAIDGKSKKDFIEAQKATPGDTVDFEWESLKGRKLQFKIEDKPREDNGQLVSKITDFAPYDYQVPF